MGCPAKVKFHPCVARRGAMTLQQVAAALAFSLSVLTTTSASATVSILAYDAKSEVLGATVVSCLDLPSSDFKLAEVVRLEAQRGGVVAQGYFFEEGRDTVLGALKAGSTAKQALLKVTNESFDPIANGQGYAFRQYGVVDTNQKSATFTGEAANPVALAVQGTSKQVSYVVAGNFLTDEQVAKTLERGFSEADTDLAQRFVSALKALLKNGGGDQRCAPRTSNRGYATLMSSDGSSWEREVESTTEDDPAALLIEALSDQRLLFRVEDQAEDEPSARETSGCQLGHSAARIAGPLGWLMAEGLLLLALWRRRAVPPHRESSDSRAVARIHPPGDQSSLIL